MEMKRAIVIVSFGDRETNVRTLLADIRKYTKIDVWLLTERERPIIQGCRQRIVAGYELKWTNNPRWPIRNANLWLAKFALQEEYDSVCCLNDDMRILHKGFLDGFGLAEKFGVCVPMNPRIYVKYNAMGTDATNEDRRETDKGPIYGPACNMSPMFACRLHDHAKILLEAYIEELNNCMRGTLAFWLASYRTGITPLYLPEQWCLCESNVQYFKNYKKRLQGRDYPIEPIMLHWGQKGVRDAYNGVTI